MSELENTVREYLGFDQLNGIFGVEIEVEAPAHEAFPAYPKKNLWNVKNDGSLRNGLEFTFRRPFDWAYSKAALEEFAVETKAWRFNTKSIRTSVHIHYNVREFRLREYYAGCFVYWLVENLLVHINGASREGNLFCLRLKDAENLFRTLRQEFSERQFLRYVTNDNFRYSALNMLATRQFGSLEFRFFNGTQNTAEIEMWMRTIEKILEYGRTLGNPQKVVDEYNRMGPVDFVNKVLPEDVVDKIVKKIGPDFRWKMEENYAYLLMLCSDLNCPRKTGFFFRQHNEDLSEPVAFRDDALTKKKAWHELVENDPLMRFEPGNIVIRGIGAGGGGRVVVNDMMINPAGEAVADENPFVPPEAPLPGPMIRYVEPRQNTNRRSYGINPPDGITPEIAAIKAGENNAGRLAPAETFSMMVMRGSALYCNERVDELRDMNDIESARAREIWFIRERYYLTEYRRLVELQRLELHGEVLRERDVVNEPEQLRDRVVRFNRFNLNNIRNNGDEEL